MTDRDPAAWLRDLARLAVATDAQPRTAVLEHFQCPAGFDWYGAWVRELDAAEATASSVDWVKRAPPPSEPKRRSLSAKDLQCIETFRACWEPFAPPKDQRDSLWRFDVERLLRECADQHGIRCTVRLARAAFEAIGEVYDPQYRARKGGW